MAVFGKRKPLFDPTTPPHTTGKFRVQRKVIRCPLCAHNEFDQGTALLNTPGMTFFGLDWANRTATVLCCRRCGRIEWFLRQPEALI
ncbi:MAG: hypothetical protein LUO89_11670 [Methanothrix sp.]|nr:hypothetical protein [Methanothrix sp.]